MNKELLLKIKDLISKTKGKLISEKILYQGKFINLIQEEYLLPNNQTIKREKIVKNKNKEAVIVVAVTKDNKYLLVVQNRVNNIVSIEFPAGYIEPGESSIVAARRELKEETGYISNEIELIDTYYQTVGVDTSIINIVIAYNCEKKQEQELSPNEYINYDTFTYEEVKELVDNHYINSSSNRLAFYEIKEKSKVYKKVMVNQ